MHANAPRFLACATLALWIAVDPSPGSAQAFRACRVPSVGAIYMIGVSGAPSACLDPSHVEFQWTEGGVPADGSITTAKLANGAVTSAKVADGTIATADVANGAITQAKLDPAITVGVPDGSITTAKLATGAVTRERIASGAVPNWRAASYSGSPSPTAGTVSNMAMIGFNAPAAGSVWLQSSGYCIVPNEARWGIFVWGTTATERFGVGHSSSDGASQPGTYHLTYSVARTLGVTAGANNFYLNFENRGGGAFECNGTNLLLYTPAQLP